MAFTKIFFVLSLLSVTNAFFFWNNDDGRFAPPQTDSRGYPYPRSPFFSGFSDVLSFPFRFVSSGFSAFPPLPAVTIPSPDDITNTKPGPGQTYTGIYAHTAGGGEQVILANLNGRVLKFCTYLYKHYKRFFARTRKSLGLPVRFQIFFLRFIALLLRKLTGYLISRFEPKQRNSNDERQTIWQIVGKYGKLEPRQATRVRRR